MSLDSSDSRQPQTIDEYRLVNAELLRQLVQTRKAMPTRSRWHGTATWFALVTIVFGTAFGLAYQQVQRNEQNRDSYNQCVGRNSNSQVAIDLYTTLARDASAPAFQIDFARAAAAIHLQDCSVFR